MHSRLPAHVLLVTSCLAAVSSSACGGTAGSDLFGPEALPTSPGEGANEGRDREPDGAPLVHEDGGPRADAARDDADAGAAADAASDGSSSDAGADGPLLCQSGKHACHGACVVEDDSSCGPSCAICPSPPHTTPSCRGGACATTCAPGWVDCDGDAANGCETDLQASATSCGACGHDCLGTACSEGVCGHSVLATLQGDPEDLAVDGSFAYWANKTGGTVVAAPKAGGAVLTLASGQSTPRGIAIDDAYVYWANYSNVGAVRRVAKGGGGSMTVASGQYYPYRMAIDATTVYFTNDTTGGNLSSVPKTGGPVTVVAASQSSPRGVVVDGARVYWVSWEEAESIPLGGGPITKISYQEQFPFALTSDATTLFWHDGYADKIRSASKAGGAAQTVATLPRETSKSGRQLAVDSQYVYFTERTTDTIQRVPKAGGKVIVLGKASAPTGLAIDESYVYYCNQGDGSVRRVAK